MCLLLRRWLCAGLSQIDVDQTVAVIIGNGHGVRGKTGAPQIVMLRMQKHKAAIAVILEDVRPHRCTRNLGSCWRGEHDVLVTIVIQIDHQTGQGWNV